jgi:hypothetical protein
MKITKAKSRMCMFTLKQGENVISRTQPVGYGFRLNLFPKSLIIFYFIYRSPKKKKETKKENKMRMMIILKYNYIIIITSRYPEWQVCSWQSFLMNKMGPLAQSCSYTRTDSWHKYHLHWWKDRYFLSRMKKCKIKISQLKTYYVKVTFML